MIGLETRRDRCLRWAAAIVLVSAVHGGAVAWALRGPPDDDLESQTGGAFIIELSSVTTSTDEERRDVAVGKKSEEIAPVAASAPQVASMGEPQPDEQPPLPETNALPPEDTITKRPDEKPPEDAKPPEVSATRAENMPSVAPVAPSEAAAPQKIENATQVSDHPLGQNAGLSQIDRQAIENWQRDLVVHINRHKRYPAKAREAHQHGVARVAFAMDREGRVLRASIMQSTGFETLDQAAIEMLNRASPLPAPPASMPGETIGFVVPVNYRWRD
jgi:protein TonB